MLSRKETVAAYYETHHVSRVLLIVSFPKQAGIHAFLQPQDETSLFSLSFTQIFLIIELLQLPLPSSIFQLMIHRELK